MVNVAPPRPARPVRWYFLRTSCFELAGANGVGSVQLRGRHQRSATLVDGINLVSDATGVTATANGTTLELAVERRTARKPSSTSSSHRRRRRRSRSDAYQRDRPGARDEGTDVVANGQRHSAQSAAATDLLINTATLDVTTTVRPASPASIDFDITGGGALFQLGPDVVSNQQARIGITSVNTARLGGVSGKLFQLGTGGEADLAGDDSDDRCRDRGRSDQQDHFLRGRLGAFQRTSLETNRNALNDTLVNLTEAESQIRDADFAAETAALTRAQILVQSGTTVLRSRTRTRRTCWLCCDRPSWRACT